MQTKPIVLIDAGVEKIQLDIMHPDKTNEGVTVSNNQSLTDIFNQDDIKRLLRESLSSSEDDGEPKIFVTGKLAESVLKTLGSGVEIGTVEALWQACRERIWSPENKDVASVGLIDLSASGYTVMAVGKDGNLHNNLLVCNPHCGAGSGMNLRRILQKLNLANEDVDDKLKDYLGPENAQVRDTVSVRADRCGVFASSATISDKNQGIPIDVALAVTFKSEVLKACKRLNKGAELVVLTGGVFQWQFMRDCAEDCLKKYGVKKVTYDPAAMHKGIASLVCTVGPKNFRVPGKKLRRPECDIHYPAFSALQEELQATHRYLRQPDFPLGELPPNLAKVPVNIALDVGSTMAKVAINNTETGERLFLSSFDNHGDTIETIKSIFREIRSKGITTLNIQYIGVTGSGRQQVKSVLGDVWPILKNKARITDLVENYAHARGSINEARAHIQRLEAKGIDINEEFCVLVDVGGEDTKITILDLKHGEMYDNAMNQKCSAGTGSLMDSFRRAMEIPTIREACRLAMQAEQGYDMNATCAVFMQQNAAKRQAEGYPVNAIFASCYWAIVENMARTLWSQVDVPKNALVLLHGQTMLSDPLPLATMRQMQKYTGSPMYGLVPSNAGHRACLGLLADAPKGPAITNLCDLDDLLNMKFDKKLIVCHGAVCGDKASSCNRSQLTYFDRNGKSMRLQLGGCTSVNEVMAMRGLRKAPDAYKDIWEMVEKSMPQSDDPMRVIIPRSFAVSEQAYFIAKIFERLGLPVHADTVNTDDVLRAQPYFNIDTCAPNIGATGQILRLAATKHSAVLIPQIDFLPTDGKSLGKTCTTNQGGLPIAMHFARLENPSANLHLFDLSLPDLDPTRIAAQLYNQFQPIFKLHNKQISPQQFLTAITEALKDKEQLKKQIAEKAAEYIEEAINTKRNVVLACGREYILNPGVYDSYVGKLFRDKDVVTIPSYALDVELADDYGYLYWRNPHHLTSIVDAIKDQQLHAITKNTRLSAALQSLEEVRARGDSQLGLALVSTFRCGPDTVTQPMIQELLKNFDFLFVQSDAAIKQLAHLENRTNTYVLRRFKSDLKKKTGRDFEIQMLGRYAPDGLNPETDILLIPTMQDNRTLTSVMRAAGITCIDNFDDEQYDLQSIIKRGREITGDSVCAPLAGVAYDSIYGAVDVIAKLARENDPRLRGKTRIYIFNIKGSGPCRQGQYYELHRLLMHKNIDNILQKATLENAEFSFENLIMKYLIGTEENKYNFGLPEWAAIQAFHGGIMQGVLHHLYLQIGARCRDNAEFSAFTRDFRAFKEEIFQILENTTPLPGIQTLAEKTKRFESFQTLLQYFGYGLYRNNGLRTALKRFTQKWARPTSGKADHSKRLKIFVEGEAYMRAAQIEELFKNIVDLIGFKAFEMNYSPLWCYLEYMLEYDIMVAENEIAQCQNQMIFTTDPDAKKTLFRKIEEQRKTIAARQNGVDKLRNILAAPLYKAAGLTMPHPMRKVLEAARPVLPKLKPEGELGPYTGEAVLRLREGTDLFLNIAPEGCMVASMGEILTPAIMDAVKGCRGRIQTLISHNGEIDAETLRMAILKIIGPEKFYRQ